MPTEDPTGALSQAALAAQLLRRGVGVRMGVRGLSMVPTLCSGDVVELEPVTTAAVRIGDIVLAPTAQGGWLLHRVLRRPARQGQRLQTRGDALWRLDDPIPAATVAGRVRRAERLGIVVFRRRPLQDWFRAGAMLLRSGLRYRVQRTLARSNAQ